MQAQIQEGYEGMGKPRNRNGIESFEEVPMSIALFTYLGYGIMCLTSYISEIFRNIWPTSKTPEDNRVVSCDINVAS